MDIRMLPLLTVIQPNSNPMANILIPISARQIVFWSMKSARESLHCCIRCRPPVTAAEPGRGMVLCQRNWPPLPMAWVNAVLW